MQAAYAEEIVRSFKSNHWARNFRWFLRFKHIKKKAFLPFFIASSLCSVGLILSVYNWLNFSLNGMLSVFGIVIFFLIVRPLVETYLFWALRIGKINKKFRTNH